MDEAKTSLMMKFEADGGPVRAECPLVIDPYDTLATKPVIMQPSRLEVPGFRLLAPGQLPRYFLISKFEFGATLGGDEKDGDDAGGSSANGKAGRGGVVHGKPVDVGHRHSPGGLGLGHRDDTPSKGSGDSGSAASGSSGSSDFALWRSATDDSKKAASKSPNNSPDQIYKSKIESFTFTRLIDCATSTLVKACCDSTSFKSASIIKRKPASGNPKHNRTDMAFIRLDFAGVKITSLKFADGDVVTETCVFSCDAMQITYAQQDASGKLTALAPVSWQNPVADTKGRTAS
jgi:type VI protein secretion system component Hcp